MTTMCVSVVQGKYLPPDGGPKEARLNKYKGRYAEAESRYGPRPNVTAAVQAYVSLAGECGISPTALALRSDAPLGLMHALCVQPCLLHLTSHYDAIKRDAAKSSRRPLSMFCLVPCMFVGSLQALLCPV